MATIDNFGGSTDPLSNPPLGGPGGWAESVADALKNGYAIRPNTTDLLVKSADGVAAVRYDSGWRDVSNLLGGGFTGGDVRLRRLEGVVYLTVAGLTRATPTSTFDTLLQIPSGFTANTQTFTGISRSAHVAILWWDDIVYMQSAQAEADYVSLSWATMDAIPATLPGVAWGPVPSS